MSGRLRFEAWTLPTSATFERILTIDEVEDGTGLVAMSSYADQLLLVPAAWEGLADIVPSLIRVYDGPTLIDEFIAERTENTADRSRRGISGPQINGIAERLAVYPYNYPNDSPTAPDWIWGGENQLPSLALTDLNNVNEEWHLHTVSDPFALTVDGQATSSLSTPTAKQLETALQALSNVNDVTVDGIGVDADNPFVIIFYDPPDPTTVTVSTGTGTLDKQQEGGLDASPITHSQYADQRVDVANHGTYGSPPIIPITQSNLDTDATWALQVNAEGQFAGSQIIVRVDPGQTYQASIRVKPSVAGSYRLVIRDIYENLIKATSPFEVSLSAGSYQDLTISDIVIPDGVTEVIMRVAVVSSAPAEIDTFWVNWEAARFDEGQAQANPHEIIRALLDAGQDRGAFEFLDMPSTDTVDAAGTAWPSDLSFTVFFGARASLAVALEQLDEMGYPWQIIAKDTPVGALTHDLEIFASKPGGTDHTASAGGPSVTVGGDVPRASLVERFPDATAMLAHGFEGLRLEDTDAAGVTAVGRWERIVDAEHLATDTSLQEFLDARFAEQASNARAAEATVLGTDQSVPLVDYRPGDTIWWQFPGILDKEARPVRQISWAVGEPAVYHLHGSRVMSREGAMAAAVDKLLRAFQRRRRRERGGTPILGGGGGMLYKVICADTEPAEVQKKADFVVPHDDIDALQAAINAVPFYGTIWIAGYFDFPSGGLLEFHSNAIIRGLDRSGIQFDAGADCQIGFGQNTVVYDLGFSGSTRLRLDTSCTVTNILTVNGDGTDPFITVNGAGVRINDVWALGADYDGGLIESDGHSDIWMGHIEMIGGTKGIRMESSAKFYLNLLRTTGVDEEILEIQNCDDWQVGTILDTGSGDVEVAIHIWDTCENGSIHAASMDGSGFGPETVVLVEDSKEITFGKEFRILDVFNSHGVIIRNSDECQFFGQVRRTRGSTNVYDNIRLEGTGVGNRIEGVSEPSAHATEKTRYGINVVDSTVDDSIVVGNDLGDPADYGTDALNDAGTGTILTYPGDATYGDNFTA